MNGLLEGIDVEGKGEKKIRGKRKGEPVKEMDKDWDG